MDGGFGFWVKLAVCCYYCSDLLNFIVLSNLPINNVIKTHKHVR